MNLFHSHYFSPSDKDKEILYCPCGETKDIHRHIWEVFSEINELSQLFQEGKRKIGNRLKCKICGELKTSYFQET